MQGFNILLKGASARQILASTGAWTWVFRGPGAVSIQLIQLNHGRQGSKVSVSLFANQLPFPAKRQSRLLLITKKYYPLAGGSQQHQYPKQTDTVCLEAWCLVQLSCQIQAHRSSYSRSEREEGKVCYHACCSIIIPYFIFTSPLQNWWESNMQKWFNCIS